MRGRTLTWVFILLSTVCLSRVDSKDGADATQAEMNTQAARDLERADAELNRVYQAIRKEYAAEPRFLDKLRSAQRAWIAFRDAELEALFPAADKPREYGSVYPMSHDIWATNLTVERTTQLQRWLDGVEEGDVTGGSIHFRK